MKHVFATFMAAAALCLVTAAADKGDPSLNEFFRVTLGLGKPIKQQQEPQPLLVIGAGLPRTGTASFVVALDKLGLLSYHMKDGVMETPNHLNMWYDLYVQQSVSFDDILDDMSAFGFNATSDAPICFWYQEQMKRYPNAKVVLTVRTDGHAWAKSFTSSIIDVMLVLDEIPFRWIHMFEKVRLVVPAFLRGLGTDVNPATGYPVIEQLPDAYNKWVERVKKTVPKDKLLVHSPKDGWKPLCDFLSPLSTEVESNCDSILASGEPYPHVNDKAKVQGLLVGLWFLSTLCKLLPVFVAVSIKLMSQRWKRKDKSKSD